MFQVTLKNGVIRKVEFYYCEMGKRETRCRILDESDKLMAWGTAKCSPKDQFNKNVGRKIALTNAISNYDKSIRQQFWEGYFQARNGKKE